MYLFINNLNFLFLYIEIHNLLMKTPSKKEGVYGNNDKYSNDEKL